MATALAGKAGAVKIDTGATTGLAVGKIKNWSLDIGYDTLDVTSFESTGDWREFLAGLSQWSGSFDGLWAAYGTDANGQDVIRAALLTPAILYIELFAQAGYCWYGTVFANATSITASVDGTVDASFTFQGSGALAYASEP